MKSEKDEMNELDEVIDEILESHEIEKTEEPESVEEGEMTEESEEPESVEEGEMTEESEEVESVEEGEMAEESEAVDSVEEGEMAEESEETAAEELEAVEGIERLGDNQSAGEIDAAAAVEIAQLANEIFGEAEDSPSSKEEEHSESGADTDNIEATAEESKSADTSEENQLTAALEAIAAIEVARLAQEMVEEAAEEAEAIEELEEAAEEAEAIEELEEAAEEAEAIEELEEAAEEAEAIEELEEAAEEAEAIEELEEAAEEAEAIEALEEAAEESEAIEELEEAAEEAEAIEELEEAAEEAEAIEELEETAEEAEAIEEFDETPKKAGKKRTAWRKALIVLVALVAIVLLVFAAGYGVFTHYYNKLNRQALKDNYDIVSKIDVDDDYDEEAQDSSAADIADLDKYVLGNLNEGTEALQFDDENVTNILLIGTDNRGSSSKRSRSDSMIILSINRRTKKIIMTSVMRDTYANIPGVGNTRINAAYAYGGPELLIDTIEKNFKIHLDKYAQVDFYSFMDVVDAAGGVTLNVSAAEIKVMNKIYIPELNEHLGLPLDKDKLKESDAGVITMNGKQAVAYSRVRYVGNADFGRTERQRKILNEIFKTAKSMSASELDNFANVALPCVTTNLTQGEVLSLLINSPEYLTYELVSARMPADGTYQYLTIRKMSVLGVDFAENRKYWYQTVYGKEE